MSVRKFRAKIKAGKTAEMEKAGKEVLAAIEAAAPQGVRYAWCKLPDDETYVLLVDLDDDDRNPSSPYRPSRTPWTTSRTTGSPSRWS